MDKRNCLNCDQWMNFVESEEDKELCEYPEEELCQEDCKKYHTAECCYYYDQESSSCTLREE